MRRKIVGFSIVVFFMGVAASLAGLSPTPLLNHSFEYANGGTNYLTGYGYQIDDWYENEKPGGSANFWEAAADIGLVGDGNMWGGCEIGSYGKFYQDIGTVDDGVAYNITALIGSRWGTSFEAGSFSLYASTADAATNAADGVELSSFATLLSTITVTTADGVPTGDENVWTVSVNLPTTTGYDGEVLWLELGSDGAGKPYFDNIAIAPSSAATAPGPVWTNSLFAASEGYMTAPYSDNLANRAVDAAGDAIIYAKTAGEAWLTVAPGGALSGTPDVLGLNTFTVTATDGTGTSSATLQINVETNTPPQWIEPVEGNPAYVDDPYTDTLVDQATDPNDQSLSFSLLETNTWLTVNPNGTMQGIPTITDAGTNTFTVTVSDGAASSTTTLTLVVEVNNQNTIAFNFSERWFTKMVQGDGILYGTDQWTDSVNHAAPNGTTVANSAGDTNAVTTPINAPGVTVAWSSANMWSAGDALNSDLETQLFNRYLDDGGSGITITVSGLSSWLTSLGAEGYRVVFYQNSDTADNTFGSWDIDDGIVQETTPPTLTDGSGSGGGSRLVNDSSTVMFTGDVVTMHTYRDYGATGRSSVSGFTLTPIIAYTPGAPVQDLVISGPFNGGMELSWTGEAGKFYGVDTSANLTFGPGWTSWVTNLLGNGGTMSVTNAIGPDQTFYRVISE